MNDLVQSGDKRMTVKEVAESLSVSERTVQRHLKDIRGDSDNVVGVEHGKTSQLYEIEATEIKRRIERSGRNDLGNVAQVAATTTDLEMRQKAAEVMAWLMRDNEQLRSKNAELEPKAAFFDQVADSKTAVTMRDAAAALNLPGWGRNNLFAFLRDAGILDDRNIPYRDYQDRGYFRVVERSWTDDKGEAHVTLTTLVYQKGLDYIRREIGKR